MHYSCEYLYVGEGSEFLDRDPAYGTRDHMDQTPDDIFALYSRFDLDGDNYRVFAKADPNKLQRQSQPSEPGIRIPAEPSVTLEALSRIEAERHDETPDRKDARPDRDNRADDSPVESARIATTSAENSRLALRSLWQVVKPIGGLNRLSNAAALGSASIEINAAAGGVGVTTIAAILARLLAKAGRRCAILDENDDPALPIHFGGGRSAADHRGFAGLRSVFEPSVKIINRAMFAHEPGNLADSAGFLDRNCTQLASQFDHVIFDRKARQMGDLGFGVSIVTATPDVGSLTGTRRFLESVLTRSKSERVICVLNRFDSSIALHRELLGWYREHFAQLVVVHQSPLVAEALAEGTTVVDWAPQSRVSLDFLELHKAVSQQLGISGGANGDRAGMDDFVSERLSLCS